VPDGDLAQHLGQTIGNAITVAFIDLRRVTPYKSASRKLLSKGFVLAAWKSLDWVASQVSIRGSNDRLRYAFGSDQLLPHYPRGHRAQILDDRGLQRVGQLAA
jgi:hypothetical protein